MFKVVVVGFNVVVVVCINYVSDNIYGFEFDLINIKVFILKKDRIYYCKFWIMIM